jgi:tape measure domain-containing protein
MTQLEPLNVRVTGSAAGLSVALGSASNSIQAFAKKTESQLKEIQGSIPSIGKIGTSLATGFLAFKALDAFKIAAGVEQAAISFEVLLGSASRAKVMLTDLRDIAQTTPLTFVGVQENAKMMLGFGVTTEQITENIRILGNIAGGSSEKMRLLTLAFSQSSAAGRLMGQDLLQMINAGFNPLQQISINTGRSISDLRKDMENGLITFDIVRQAFIDVTSEGGRFYNMLDRQSETLVGQFMKLYDSVTLLASNMATVFMPAAKGMISSLDLIVSALAQWQSSSVQSYVAIAAAVTAFAAIVAIAPAVVAAFTAIAKSQALMQAFAGPRGWVVLALSSLAAIAAFAGVNMAMNSYAESVDRARLASIKAAGEASQLAEAIKNVEASASKAAVALAEMASQGLAGPDMAAATANLERLKKELEANLALAEAMKARLADTSAAREGIASLLTTLEELNAKYRALAASNWVGGPGDKIKTTAMQKLLDEIALVEAKIAQLQKQTADNPDELKKQLEEQAKAAAQLQADIDSVGASLEKNKKYWEDQAAAARRTFELPIETFRRTVEALGEAVAQGGLEMEFFQKGVEKAKQELEKAVEAKKELGKPVQFAAGVSKNSMEEVQARFRFVSSTANNPTFQTNKILIEANAIHARIEKKLEKLPQPPPVGKI